MFEISMTIKLSYFNPKTLTQRGPQCKQFPKMCYKFWISLISAKDVIENMSLYMLISKNIAIMDLQAIVSL